MLRCLHQPIPDPRFTLLANFLFSSSAMDSFSFLSNCQGGILTVSVISTRTNMVVGGEETPTASGIGALRPDLGRHAKVWHGARRGGVPAVPKEKRPERPGTPLTHRPHAEPRAPTSRRFRGRRSQSRSAGGARALIDTARGGAGRPPPFCPSSAGRGRAGPALPHAVTGAGEYPATPAGTGFGNINVERSSAPWRALQGCCVIPFFPPGRWVPERFLPCHS